MKYLENKTFDEINLGDEANLLKTLSKQDIALFAIMSGDVNPEHLDEDYAKSTMFHEIIAHGMWGGALISSVLGTKLPGPGTVYLEQGLKFLKPIAVGDSIKINVKVIDKQVTHSIVRLSCTCTNQRGEQVITGEATVIAPKEKLKIKRIALPEVELKEDAEQSLCHQLIESAKAFPALITAVVQPIDENSLVGAIEAAEDKLIMPILVGEEAKIRAIAKQTGTDISQYQLVAAQGEHEAVLKAIELVKENKVEAIMKGNIHTDGLLSPIVSKESGLYTGRRISHVFVLDVPSYHKLLFLTDAAININPSLADKKDIIQNAIDLFKILGLGDPKVAIISATETVTEKMQATLDAAALCKMADRGQITGGLLDGPLAFDNAVSKVAAKAKGIVSNVAGDADIIVVSNLETGNALYKQMRYLFQIEGAGIVLGTKVPIILTSRAAEPGITRKFSCAISLLYARYKHSQAKK
jgi:phosphate acetyltransferase